MSNVSCEQWATVCLSHLHADTRFLRYLLGAIARVCVCVCVCVCARFQSQVIVPCQCMFQPTGNGGRRFQHNCCTHCSGASVVACTYVSVCVDVSVDWHRQMSVQVVVRFIIVAVAVCRATPHTTYIDRTKWRLGVSEE